jgi:hypothetical protein
MDMRVHEALEFYSIAIATVGGVILNFTHLDPVRALLWSAEINGVIAAPIMAIMMLLARREDIHGTVRGPVETPQPRMDRNCGHGSRRSSDGGDHVEGQRQRPIERRLLGDESSSLCARSWPISDCLLKPRRRRSLRDPGPVVSVRCRELHRALPGQPRTYRKSKCPPDSGHSPTDSPRHMRFHGRCKRWLDAGSVLAAIAAADTI